MSRVRIEERAREVVERYGIPPLFTERYAMTVMPRALWPVHRAIRRLTSPRPLWPVWALYRHRVVWPLYLRAAAEWRAER